MEHYAALRTYYKSIFPYKELYEVFRVTGNREISFTTQQGTYLRYVTCDSSGAFYEKLQSITPKKIDFGGFYSTKPSKHSVSQGVRRELVFDIDLTDYPRGCCDGKTLCEKCYEIIKCSIKLLEYTLREELGFSQVGYVFSGRRGLHCWVFDDDSMSPSVLRDIVKYYQTIIDKELYVPEYDFIMREFAEDAKNIIRHWFLRIDAAVTASSGHLVKVPFSVHPDSMRIAVPLDPENVPELCELPTLRDVVTEPAILGPYIETMKNWRR